ncbi:hypothetical protein EVG20_g10209 [Dentipellis fragilis]|uniref:Uncharacterized protein n=1 Tax=Dentipellis fragilis TaxID=205917 RepID=A0A4Y9XSY2_9AGAM|nr:hypothetical protein EVG20_g10209 [Dentipellis fragilis]
MRPVRPRGSQTGCCRSCAEAGAAPNVDITGAVKPLTLTSQLQFQLQVEPPASRARLGQTDMFVVHAEARDRASARLGGVMPSSLTTKDTLILSTSLETSYR